MATFTTTGGAQFGAIPLDTLMVDRDAVVEIVSGSASGVVDTVSGMIASAVSTAWKAGGSIAASGDSGDALVRYSGGTWTAPMLTAENEGKVYNITEDFDITSATSGFFKESSGTHIEAGTNVAVIADPLVSGGYVYDVLAGMDATEYAFSQINVSGQESVAADARQDVLTLAAGSGISISTCGTTDTVTIGTSGLVHQITIPDVSATQTSGAIVFTPNASGIIDINSGIITRIETDGGDSGHTGPDSSGILEILGSSGISTSGSGRAVIISASGLVSGVNAVTTELAALQNFSGVSVYATSGASSSTSVTASGKTANLKLKAGNAIALSGNDTDKAVTIGHATCGPSSTGNTSKGDTTAQTPGFGSSFKALSATVDKYGHVTALAEHNVTIPSTLANTAVDGLMSSGDKSKLDGISSGANFGYKSVKGTNGTTATANATSGAIEFTGNNITAAVTAADSASTTVALSVADASTSAKGVVKLASTISDTGSVVPTASQVSGHVSGVKSGLEATMVSGGSLHTALNTSGLLNGAGSTNNTIYALINALHSVDKTTETAAG